MKKSLIVSCLLACAGLTSSALAEPTPDVGPGLVGHHVQFTLDSGLVSNKGREAMTVYSTLVSEPGASWMRLEFGNVKLSGSLEAGTGTFLKITSLMDGEFQYLDAETILDWNHTSAYMNGDTVRVEVIAYPGTGANQIQIRGAMAGDPVTWSPETICGPVDDRKPSKDPRSCRVMPIGCSAWMIDRGGINKAFSSAGHCNVNTQVMMFNCPLSGAGGNPVAPPPKDQYAVDATSVTVNSGSTQPGNDFAVFGAKANSTTGLTAFQAQGAFYILSDTMPATGVPIRITGYGTTSSPISPTWNQAQKTHAGGTLSNNSVNPQYNTDTTGGNSGSPIINENNGEAIGVHGYGGCTSGGGANSGTGLNLTAYKNASNTLKGVAKVSLADNCYADMDNNNVLSVDDFITFQTLFALGDVSANCDGSVTLTDPVAWIWTPTLTVDDFICFQTAFALGC